MSKRAVFELGAGISFILTLIHYANKPREEENELILIGNKEGGDEPC